MEHRRVGVISGSVTIFILIFSHIVYGEWAQGLAHQLAGLLLPNCQGTVLLSSPLHRWENSHSEGSSDSPKVTQPVRSGSRLQTRSDSKVRAFNHPTK